MPPRPLQTPLLDGSDGDQITGVRVLEGHQDPNQLFQFLWRVGLVDLPKRLFRVQRLTPRLPGLVYYNPVRPFRRGPARRR